MKVTVKSIPVRYDGDRYLKGETLDINEKHFNDKLFEEVEDENPKDPENPDGEGSDGQVDLRGLSEAELKKVKNDDLKAFLKQENIDFATDAVKDDLIELVINMEQGQ